MLPKLNVVMRNPLVRSRRPVAAPPTPLPEAEAERLGRTSTDGSFLTGNGLAARCRYVLNFDGFTVNESAATDWYFCKVDHLEWFFQQHAPRRPYVLVSHNGDYAVNERFRRELRGRRLRVWLAANAEIRHPKVVPVPLGIANSGWEHGDARALRAAQRAAPPRTELFDVSFSLETRPEERRYCLDRTGLTLADRLPHGEYLRRLASAYFCVSPSGHGIDTHRTWEALYLRTVPVVTRSALTDEWSDLPMVVLDDWAEFRSIDFSPALYERLMAGWDPASLSEDAVLARLRRRVASQR